MSDEEEESLNIVIDENDIYFYDVVSDRSILKLNVELRKLERKLTDCKKGEITIFINSVGGDVFSGFSAMDHINACKVPVTTVADGLCCSAATLLFLGGKKRLVKKHSHFLIHQISSDSSSWLKFEDMKDDMKNSERLMERMVDVYRERTELPENKLRRLMKHDVYLTCDQCVKYSIASGVYGDGV